jgi:hypothetical protein
MKRLIRKAFDYKEMENTSRDYCNFIEQNLGNGVIDAKQAEQLYQITDRLHIALEEYKTIISSKMFRQLNVGSRKMESDVSNALNLVELIWGLAQMWKNQITKEKGTYYGIPGLQKITNKQLSIMDQIKRYLNKTFINPPDLSYVNSPNSTEQDVKDAVGLIVPDLNKGISPFRSIWDFLSDESVSDSDYTRIENTWQQVKNQDWEQRYNQVYEKKSQQSNGNMAKTNIHRYRWMKFMNDPNFVGQVEQKLMERGWPLFGPERT